MENGETKKSAEHKEAVQAIQVRFPVWMYEELKDRAVRDRRSFNNEVVHLIQVLFDIGDMVEAAREGSGDKADA
jgi:hypothetical protein